MGSETEAGKGDSGRPLVSGEQTVEVSVKVSDVRLVNVRIGASFDGIINEECRPQGGSHVAQSDGRRTEHGGIRERETRH
jgi:hypothetical protein